MANKKLTAVEWLRENLHLAKDPFTQALELEKEQIIDFGKSCVDRIMEPIEVSRKSLEQSNAKLLEALDDAESVIETIYKECSPHESAWHLANEFILKRQAIQQSESKSKDNE